MALGERTRTTAQAAAQGLRVFVAGIPWSVSEEVLQRDFAECGVVEDLFLLRDAEGNSRGRCFITFRDKKGVKAALEYDSTDYAGRTIYVKIAEDKPKGFEVAKSQVEKKAKEESFPADKPEGCVSLCLKNLGEATEADVRKFLKKCSIQAVRIVIDRDTGASRGIAFVDFTASEEVDKAMKKNGSELNGQTVSMKYEAPRSRPRPDGCMAVAVKKLGPNTTEADIRELFGGLESLSDARVICKDKACIGLAFAEFTKAADVEAAVRRDGMAVRGRTVFVCYETKSRKPRAAPGDGEQSAGAGDPGKKGKKSKQKGKKPGGEAAAEAAAEVAGGAEEEEGGEQDEQPQASQKSKKKGRRKEQQEDADEGQAAAEEEAGEEREAAAEAAPGAKARKKRRKAAAAAAAAAATEEQEEAAPEEEEDGGAAPEAKPRKKKRRKKGE